MKTLLNFVEWRQVYARIALKTTKIYLKHLWTKHCKRIKKLKETGDLNYIYKDELNKACSAHDAAYADSNNLAKRTVLDKVLKDRTSEIALKYLFCVIDVFTKYAWVKSLTNKKAKPGLDGFIRIVNESKCKTNKL